MIGLGSNRLSVCRRGGMSVTQAGRGGMEWLAGGRLPSWASPYSAQATAALKAQFPTQWPTIRDYGFAHPEIVPYVNQYALEDAGIALSLCNMRYLVSDGNQYIKLGHLFKKPNEVFDCLFYKDGNNNDRAQWIFGERQFADSAGATQMTLTAENKSRAAFGAQSYASTPFDFNNVDLTKPCALILSKDIYTINGIAQQKEPYYAMPTTGNMYLFGLAQQDDTAYPNLIFKGGIGRFKTVADPYWYVPYTRNGVNGILDVYTGTFKANNGTGAFSFTISETPAS